MASLGANKDDKVWSSTRYWHSCKATVEARGLEDGAKGGNRVKCRRAVIKLTGSPRYDRVAPCWLTACPAETALYADQVSLRKIGLRDLLGMCSWLNTEYRGGEGSLDAATEYR